MLLERLMPCWDATRIEHRVINAPVGVVYDAVVTTDLLQVVRESVPVRVLFQMRAAAERIGSSLRSQPAVYTSDPETLRLIDSTDCGEWVCLGADAPKEFTFGAIGRFWSGETRWEYIRASDFAGFDQPGFAKIGCRLTVSPFGESRSLLTYEARTEATDDVSRRAFRRYWRVVSPFVGIVMRATLTLMARTAESEPFRSEEKPVGVLYTTREGQTKRIAGHIARALRDQGFLVDLGDVADRAGFNPSSYAAVILAAPVHAGRHSSQMVKFVQRYRTDLDRFPNAFISVTLSEAGVERTNSTPEDRARFAADVQKVIAEFVKETGWQAKYVKPVAGALMYTQYNFLIRRIMKGIATKVHAETDTSRDCEYTNWPLLDSWITEFSAELRRQEPLRRAG